MYVQYFIIYEVDFAALIFRPQNATSDAPTVKTRGLDSSRYYIYIIKQYRIYINISKKRTYARNTAELHKALWKETVNICKLYKISISGALF